jgi:hypothetical protein
MIDVGERRSMSHRSGALATLVVAFGASAAHAQEISGGDIAAAEALFGEGRRLSDAGSFADACARFEASMGLVPRLGVQLNLADCYEHIGKTASAWVTFGQAAALARRMGDERERLALERQDALVPRLTRLRLSVARADVDGFLLTRDGMRVASTVYGVEVPVDPGIHRIEATAAEHLPWSTRVVVAGEGEVVTVVIPELERTPSPPRPPLIAPAPRDARDARRGATRMFWISAGVGVAGIGAGAMLGIAARSLWQQARPDCDPSGNCTGAAYALIDRSRRDGNLSTLAFGVGAIALATSIVLYVRSSRAQSRSALRLVPAITSSAAGAAVAGVFQ